ncbi:RagB/SusD family nutrient uptake outer membrane protein [Bacteroides intestinalis]|jgi:hypothetical protein|uniref:RagB/SusD family nutrient uptake outer membrane protein n=1 Tax=Bacteroides intestinalis TaxID=329854 RepID=UPI0022E5376A|nr:RagB/SusD family nutrient uptake outer membrane protein [Bacteroides intestinalis]
MKNSFKYILMGIVLAGATLVSCDDLLETKNFSDMSPSNFFKTEGDMAAAVTGIYLPCTTNWGYSDGGTGKWYNALFNADINAYYPAGMVTTDAVRHYSSNIFDEFTVGPATQGALINTYNIIRFVARATDVINQISKSSGATEDIRNRFIAETKTLRAFYMYTLLDWYGPVNVKLDPETLMDNSIQPRPSVAEYVANIDKDLEEAIATTSFPDKYNSDELNWGRMSKAIAYGIRMKLHMHQKEWAKAKEDASKLMTMGFSILDNYEDVFNISRTSEHIWSIPSNLASDNYYITEILPSDFKRGYNHKGDSYIRGNESSHFSGWQVFCMRWEFYDTFADNDIRKKTILCEYNTNDDVHKDRNSGMVGAIPLKYTDTQFANYGIQKEHPAIRYAEVLLSYAEAENELNGPTQGAINAVKQITDRAGVTIPASATTDKDAFRTYLLAERGRELYCEGQRRQDLIRHGVYISLAKARGNNAKDYQVLFPIPQNVVTEAGGIIDQNEGYTR